MIVIIEDFEPVARVLRALLAPASVVIVSSMAAAHVVMLRVTSEDTVLVDLRLPDSTPWKTLAQIATWRNQTNPPKIIVMTGNLDSQVIEEAHIVADAVALKHDGRGLFQALTDLGVIKAKNLGPCLNEQAVRQIEDEVAHLIA